MNDVVLSETRKFVAEISAAWNKSLDGVLEVGRLLARAKEELPHGSFEAMVTNELPFGSRMARQLMAVSNDARISNRIYRSDLPNSWGTLYDLTKLDDGTWALALERGIIRPDMERKDLAPLLVEQRRARNQGPLPARETSALGDLAVLVAEGKKFGTIYADPPWLYSNQGTRAATHNHYGGMTVAEICALPIKSLAADDAHLHLWTTNGFLFDAPKVFDAWGFEFRSSFVWVKSQMGIGNYWRNSHEFLLTAIRGNAKRFNDKTLKSWVEYKRQKHSAKPEEVRGFLERASQPPFLELFGRSPIDGWTVWGDQIARPEQESD